MSFLIQTFLVAATVVIVALIIAAYLKPSRPVPEIFGTVAPGFEEVREAFRRNYEDGWDVSEGGSAFSVYKDGEKVVDLWAGYADYEAKRLWREDTLTVIFSATKGLAALVVGMLADRGHVDYKKPVAQYWPEFAQKGKEKITVQQLLQHEAGLCAVKEPLRWDQLRDHEVIDKVLAESEPLWEPGTHSGYHAFTFGPLVDALVRRVDPKKRTIGQFFEDEVRKPFDIDAYIGPPLELDHRIARCSFVQGKLRHLLYGLLNMDICRRIFMAQNVGLSEHYRKTVRSAGELGQFERLADPEIRKIEFASVNGVATARGIAKLYGILANGGQMGNQTLLSRKIIDEYVNDGRLYGLPDLVMAGMPVLWKHGMNLIKNPRDGSSFFGCSGVGGQVAYADPKNKVGYGFLSRYMSPMGLPFVDPRMRNLHIAVMKSLHRQR